MVKCRVAAISGHAAIDWLFGDFKLLWFESERGCAEAGVLWRWRLSIVASGEWCPAAHDVVYGAIRCQRTIFCSLAEAIENYDAAVCLYASAIWLAAVLRHIFPNAGAAVRHHAAIEILRFQTCDLRSAQRSAASSANVIVEAVGFGARNCGRSRDQLLFLVDASGGQAELTAIVRELLSECIGAPISRSFAMQYSASSAYLEHAFDPFRPFDADDLFQSGAIGVGFEPRPLALLSNIRNSMRNSGGAAAASVPGPFAGVFGESGSIV
jgi:hypothetical protein